MTIAILVLASIAIASLVSALLTAANVRRAVVACEAASDGQAECANGSKSVADRMLALEGAMRDLTKETHALYENWRLPNDIHIHHAHDAETPPRQVPPLETVTPAAKPRRKRK